MTIGIDTNFEKQFNNNSSIDADDEYTSNNSSSESDSESEKKIKSKNKKEKKIIINDDKFTIDNIDDLDYKMNIRLEARTVKKKIIKIENIPNKFLENKDMMNNLLINLRTDMASRATLKLSKDKFKFIELSGNRIDLVINRLKNDLGCSNNNIILHGL
jgi:translation initiation factor 1 (eIF-1/SUI1)